MSHVVGDLLWKGVELRKYDVVDILKCLLVESTNVPVELSLQYFSWAYSYFVEMLSFWDVAWESEGILFGSYCKEATMEHNFTLMNLRTISWDEIRVVRGVPNI